jgi:predicted RNA-binding protein YlxR (DUF448 family)
MRFIKLPSGKIVLDLSSRMNGRGFYICSDDLCLDRLTKGKANRFPVKSSEVDVLTKDMLGLIADEINRLIVLCIKMGFAGSDLHKSKADGDVIIIKQEATEKTKETINKTYQNGYVVFTEICDPVMLKSDMLIINALWPMRDNLISKLDLFKRLSFRGAAL